MKYELQNKISTKEISKNKTFCIKINNTFLSTIGICGNNIDCYSPDEDYRKKLIEIGIKRNQSIFSLFEEDNSKHFYFLYINYLKDIEIENVEVLFTDKGILICKLYSTNHPYDTR